MQRGCSFCPEVPEPRTLLRPGHGALTSPLPSLRSVRSWHQQRGLWERRRALPLLRLFTGEVNRDLAEQMLGPTGQPWEAHATESSS